MELQAPTHSTDRLNRKESLRSRAVSHVLRRAGVRGRKASLIGDHDSRSHRGMEQGLYGVGLNVVPYDGPAFLIGVSSKSLSSKERVAGHKFLNTVSTDALRFLLFEISPEEGPYYWTARDVADYLKEKGFLSVQAARVGWSPRQILLLRRVGDLPQ